MGKREWAIVGVALLLGAAAAAWMLRPVPPCSWGQRQYCQPSRGEAPRPGESVPMMCVCIGRNAPNPPPVP